MPETRKNIGAQYERLAGKYLTDKGYNILEYNFRCRSGEIDLIAKRDGVLVFCEVKYRKDAVKGHPLEAVTVCKQRRICRCALCYLLQKGCGTDVPCRFDVVGILDNEIIHIENAFEYIE